MSTPALDPDAQARPGATFFVMAFLACAVVLLLNLEAQTKFSSRGSIVAQPRFWPAVGVIGMVGFGMLHLFFAAKGRSEFGSYREVITWVRALEFLAWFMVYVFAVPYIGYLLATVLFTSALALRMGYRRLEVAGAALVGLAIVVVFKAGLAVKIPGGAIYEVLPDGLRNFMIVNF